MSILTQFYLYPHAGTEDQMIAASRRLGAFHRALNIDLGRAKVRAPFVKVAPSISPGVRDPNPFVYQGIAHVQVDADPLMLLSIDPHTARRMVAGWAAMGLVAVASKTGWDATPVLEIIASVGAHEGPYRDQREKAAVVDRAGVRWVPMFEWDETGAAFLVEARDTSGTVVGRTELLSDERPWMVDYDRIKVRRTPGAIEYVVGQDQVLACLSLDGAVEVSTEQQGKAEPPLRDLIPRPSRRGKADLPDDEFWGLIGLLDWSRGDDHQAVLDPLIDELARRPRRERHAFDNTLARLLYDLDGRAWARRMGLGWYGESDDLSTDTFVYARCAVVAQGQAYYETVRRDPSQMRPDEDFEVILYATSEAQQRLTGEEDEFETRLSYETFSNSAGWD